MGRPTSVPAVSHVCLSARPVARSAAAGGLCCRCRRRRRGGGGGNGRGAWSMEWVETWAKGAWG
jgi:hypothetical protein